MLAASGRRVEVLEDGFLADAAAWDTEVAEAMAASVEIELTENHWEIIRFMRSYYERFQHLPNNRMFVKAIQAELGSEKGNSLYLNSLFPGSPVRLACLIAGLPRPPGCL